MSISEFIFYLLILFSVAVNVVAIRSFASRRRCRKGWMLLRIWLILLALYGAVLISASLALPIRVLPVGEAQFSGDWSIAVSGLQRVPHGLDEDYFVDFQLYNRSKAVRSGPTGLSVYLLDENGTRYNPEPSPSGPAFDVAIQPWQKVTTTRRFVMPTNLNRMEVVIVQGGFRLAWFTIGRSPFDGHTVVQLQ